jgi:peptidyl-prolyl cis-trans isomerase D
MDFFYKERRAEKNVLLGKRTELSMLNSLRRAASGWVAKFLIGLLVLSFAVWGISDVFRGLNQSTALQVGDAEISAQSFQLALNRELNQIRESTGRFISMSEARQMGLVQQVLGRLSIDAALDDRAQSFGLGISDDQLAKRIAEDPSFQVMGGFNRSYFRQLLNSAGMTEGEFITDVKKFALRQQLGSALAGDMQTPQVLLDLANRYDNELRSARYMVLTPDNLDPIPAPDEQALQDYFKERQGRYIVPELRSVRYLEVNPPMLANADSITEEDLRQEYEIVRDRLGEPEKRTLVQYLFKERDEALRARETLQNDKNADLSSFEGVTVNTLENVTQASIVDPALAEAAFALEEGQVSEVIEGRFGPVVLVLDNVTPAATPSLADVEDELRTSLAQRRAEDEAYALFDTIEDARAGGLTLAEIARQYQLPLVTIEAIDQQGRDAEGETVALPQEELLSLIFQSDVALENDPLDNADGRTIWFEVTEVTPQRDKTFEEVSGEVREDWLEDETASALEQRAETLTDQLEGGADIETLAEDNRLLILKAENFTRLDTPQTFGANGVRAAFDVTEGRWTHTALEGQPRHIVLQVTDVTVPALFEDSESVEQLRSNLSQALQDGLLTQYVTGLQDELGVIVNQPLIDQLTTPSNSPGG